jgi:hypothetical protein
MRSRSLTRDVARATSRAIVDVFAGCLREEDLHDAFTEVYALVIAGLKRFRVQENQRWQRMRPEVN